LYLFYLKHIVNSNVPSLLLSYVVSGINGTTNISATLSYLLAGKYC